MKKTTLVTLIAGALLFGFGCNQKSEPVEEAQEVNEQAVEGTPQEDTQDDLSEFMTEAASSGMMEVELGKLAQEKGRHADVKSFGQMMVNHHGKANEELKALAAKKNMMLPDSMGRDHMNHLTELREKTGADFDKAYMNLMVEEHQDDLEEFEEAARDLQDPDAKAFASKTVPTLKQHHQRAKQIKDVLDKQKQ